jgi:hypothetical protein
MKEDSLKTSAKQPNDQNDPVSAWNSVLHCSNDEPLPGDSEPESQDAPGSSLIENWIDA